MLPSLGRQTGRRRGKSVQHIFLAMTIADLGGGGGGGADITVIASTLNYPPGRVEMMEGANRRTIVDAPLRPPSLQPGRLNG